MAVRIGTAADMKGMTYSAMLAVYERAEALAMVSAFGGGRDRNVARALYKSGRLDEFHNWRVKDLAQVAFDAA